MSEPCDCPLAGYCDRHSVRKGDVWHRLCQTRDDYRAKWDDGRGPGQKPKPLTAKQADRKARIEQRVADTQRLVGWLSFLRHSDDRGAGDAAERLLQQGTGRSNAHAMLRGLLKQCSCSRTDAVAKLNADYPY